MYVKSLGVLMFTLDFNRRSHSNQRWNLIKKLCNFVENVESDYNSLLYPKLNSNSDSVYQ